MEAAICQFEHMFQSILVPGPEVLSVAPAPRERPKRTPDEETRIRRAMSLFHRGDYCGCIDAMQSLSSDAGGDSRIDAFVAASRALGQGETAAGLRACVEAVKRAGPVADVYCALGAVLMSVGDRARAHAVYRKGLTIDPLHPHLRASLRMMGFRKPPVLRSLPRRHPLNRFLGSLRAHFVGA